MKAIKFLVFLFAAAVMVTSCNKITYRKTAGGLPYKLFEGKSGSRKIQPGNFLKISLVQKIKDSVTINTQDKMPFYVRVMETPVPYDVSELWTKLHEGDSVVATQLLDTFIKRNPSGIPPQYKNGDQIQYFIKILAVFPTDSAAEADKNLTQAGLLKGEIAKMEDYLKSKNISAVKSPSGVFVQVKDPGNGATIDSGKYVSVRYKGTSFSGVMFDSNIDTASRPSPPLSFTIGAGQMIRGFDEGLRFLKNGGTAMIYVPSLLAYGPNPPAESIKPYEAIMFDVKVVGVLDKAPPPPPAPAIQQNAPGN